MIDEEKFFAWLDGELEPGEAAAMEAKVASDPELGRLAEQHRALGSRLRGAFDPIAQAPPPEGLRAALRPSAQLVDFTTARQRRSMPPLGQWAAMAASLAAGLLLGTMVPQRSNAPVAVEGGRLYAAAAVDHALDSGLASAPEGDVRIGLTFRDHSGRICRTFTGSAASGLACRQGPRWQLKGIFAAPEGQGSDYRMAGGMDPSLARLVDSTIAGDPLDAAQERAARQAHWKAE